MSGFESVVEEAAIAWLTELGWQHVPGPVLALPDFSYLVVVDDRGDFVLLWTAYPVEREHQRKKLAKRYHDAQAKKAEAASRDGFVTPSTHGG